MRLICSLVLALGFSAVAQAGSAQTADTVWARVDGAAMRLVVAGVGEVSIVLEAGFGGDHRTWSAVQAALAPLGRVVSYDRLGLGASGSSPRPRTATVLAQELREGLCQAGIRPPYLLVGHSYGGALVRVFAARYPGEVRGLVLVDPALEEFYQRAAVEAGTSYLAQLEEDLAWTESHAGPGVRREALAYETSMAQARAARLPAGLPVVLLSAGQMELEEDLRRIWLEEQGRWSAANGARRVIVDHGHRIPQNRPDEVVRAVRTLLP